MKRKKRKQKRKTSIASSTKKVSEMIWAFAGDLIQMGETLDEKQSYLNAACTAWNIACLPSDMHQRSLDKYEEAYRSYNPHADDQEIANVREDMEKLIKNKLRLFPNVNKQIVNARITQTEGKDRIDVASMTIPGNTR